MAKSWRAKTTRIDRRTNAGTARYLDEHYRPSPGVRTRGALALGMGGVAGTAVLAVLLMSSALGALPALGQLGSTSGPAWHRQAVNSNFTGTINFTSSSVVHNVTYLTATTLRTLTGNISGQLLADEWGAVQANGSMWVKGIATFVGSILGGTPGVLQMTCHATGTYGGTLNGNVLAFHGQKGLRGIYGSGNVTASFTGPSSFSGSYALHLWVP
ncbi:MAG: hypothetical protein L3K19_06700 [Thermoplasmata archaeon]|nr:hypothetical protein [Thermoplasmata archaeon]